MLDRLEGLEREFADRQLASAVTGADVPTAPKESVAATVTWYVSPLWT